MAATFGNNRKYALGYTAVMTGESSSRTIAGINTRLSTGDVSTGPSSNTAIDCLYFAVNSLSNATITNGRWITELEVAF